MYVHVYIIHVKNFICDKMSRDVRKTVFGVSDTNRPVQSQKQARSLNFEF